MIISFALVSGGSGFSAASVSGVAQPGGSVAVTPLVGKNPEAITITR